MPILPLPSTASHLITSTHLLVTPNSAIKELIDNSLDASASSISIDISANTIDIIQVKDNGHGIPPTDRGLFGRRGCTSKIRDEKDLAIIGGMSLGFRGVAVSALAGVCSDKGRRVGVCESVQVTTRVEGEDVARSWEVGMCADGNGFEAVSHPVGTTMRLTGFFATLPVRKQEAIKNVAKTLAAIKAMLQAYAMARPLVRFSLKVLRAKNHKDNWTFAPCKATTAADDVERLAREVTAKIASKDCANQCTFAHDEEGGYRVHALLPSPNAEANKISGHHYFMQLDGRPVSVSRGPFKKIASQWRDAMKQAGLAGLKEGFVWLNLKCPPGTYDINVEPAKDDAIFTDEETVLHLTARLFETAFPRRVLEPNANREAYVTRDAEIPQQPTRSPSQCLAEVPVVNDDPSETPLQQCKSFVEHSVTLPETTESVRLNPSTKEPAFAAFAAFQGLARNERSPSARQENIPWQTDMYRNQFLEGIEEAAAGQSSLGAPADDDHFDDDESEAALHSVAMNNPWVIAKVTGANRIKNKAADVTPSPTAMRETSGISRVSQATLWPQVSKTKENAATMADPTQTTLPFHTSNRINVSSPLRLTGLPTPNASSSPTRVKNVSDRATKPVAIPRRPIYPPSPSTSFPHDEAALLAARQFEVPRDNTQFSAPSIETLSRSPTPFGTPLLAIPISTRDRPGLRDSLQPHATPSGAPKPWSPFKSYSTRGSTFARGQTTRRPARQSEQFIGLSEIGPMHPLTAPESTLDRNPRQRSMSGDWASGSTSQPTTRALAQPRVIVRPAFGDQQTQRFAQETIRHEVPSGAMFTAINAPSRTLHSDGFALGTIDTPLPQDTVLETNGVNERPTFRRRSTRSRTKSHNPLPKPTSTHMLTQQIWTSPAVIKEQLRKFEAVMNYIPFSTPSALAYTGFNVDCNGGVGISDRKLKRWAVAIRSLVASKRGHRNAAVESVAIYEDAIREGLEKIQEHDHIEGESDGTVAEEEDGQMEGPIGEQMKMIIGDGEKGEDMLF